MTSDRKIRLAWIVPAGTMMFLMLFCARLAWAQDDWDAEDRAAAGPARRPLNRFDIEMQLNSWIFGDSNGAQAQQRVDSILTLRLDCIERAGGLSKAQIEKLRLAGRADAARFLRKVDAIKAEYKGVDINVWNQKIQDMWQKVQPLQAEFNAGLLGDKSLFQKVLEGMSRSDSSAPFVRQERERKKFRWQTEIELAVAGFEMGVPLTEVQRRKLLDLLFKELKPPQKFGDQNLYVVFYLAGKLDRGKLKPIFDDAQWRSVEEMFRRMEGLETHLRQQGYIP